MSNHNKNLISLLKNKSFSFRDCTEETLHLILNPPKPKSTPWKPTHIIKLILESIFKYNNKPSISLRDEIADQLEISKKSIRIWFMNRSARKLKNTEPSNIEKEVENNIQLLSVIEKFLKKYNKGDNLKDYFKTSILLNTINLSNKEEDIFYNSYIPIIQNIEDDDVF